MTNQTTVDAAELARLRAIEAAAKEWKSAGVYSAEESWAVSALWRALDSGHDNPPAPLDTDEQISRLLRENELLRTIVGNMLSFAEKTHQYSGFARDAADIDSLRRKLAAK